MARVIAIALALPLLIGACGRQFDPPPEVVALESVAPAEAFAGARVILSGRNFASPAEANLVFFGSTAAAIDTQASKVDEDRLAVVVPVLADINAEVSLTVSTATSQAVLSDAFIYSGPGHPLDERVHHLLPIEASPNTIAMVLPDERLDQINPALVTNTSSRTISLMDLWTGWHVDLGFPGQPLSAVLLPWQDEPRPPNEEEDGALAEWRDPAVAGCFEIHQYAIYATVLLADAPEHAGDPTLRTEIRSKKLSFVVPAADAQAAECAQAWGDQAGRSGWFLPVLSEMPASARLSLPAAGPGGQGWMPGQIKRLCLDLQPDGFNDGLDCRDRVLAVTDYYRPELAFVRLQSVASGSLRFDLQAPVEVSLSTQGSGCNALVADAVGPVLDLTHVPNRPALLAAAEGRPELWRIDLDPDANGDPRPQARIIWPRTELLATGLDLDAIGWRTDALAPQVACRLRFTALAESVQDGSSKLYMADSTTGTLIEALVADVQIGLASVEALLPRRSLSLGAPVFALQAALQQDGVDPPGELLYAATEDGLAVVQTDGIAPDSFAQVGFVSLPASRGGPGSLARYGLAGSGWDDRVALADSARNQLFVLTAGVLDSDPEPFPAGSVRPQVAASRWSDLLYLADPLSDTIRLIDQNTGLQAGKFLASGDRAFGALGLRCLHRWSSDLLLVPMANEILDPLDESKTFNEVVVRQARDLSQLEDYGSGLVDPEFDQGQKADDYQAHHFNEALVAPDSALIYLVQYHDHAEPDTGLVWPAAIDASGELSRVLLDGPDFPAGDYGISPFGRRLPDWVRLVRLSSDERLLVTFGQVQDGSDTAGRVEIFQADTLSDESDPTNSFSLPTMVSRLVEDMAVWSDGSRTVLLFSLPEAGKVLALQADEHGDYVERYIDTTGVPRWLAFSPDHKRLYVTHRAEGKLSIIETGCAAKRSCSADEPCESGLACRWGACQPAGGCFGDYACEQDSDCPEHSTCLVDVGNCMPDDLGAVGWCDPGFACASPYAECLPEPCESLLVTLPVELYPDRVVFHPSGESAYLTHEGSNVITVIE